MTFEPSVFLESEHTQLQSVCGVVSHVKEHGTMLALLLTTARYVHIIQFLTDSRLLWSRTTDNSQ